MAYCRLGSGDAYIYHHVGNRKGKFIICQSCALSKVDSNGWPKDATFNNREDVLMHMHRHRDAGHVIPSYAFERIEQEIAEIGPTAQILRKLEKKRVKVRRIAKRHVHHPRISRRNKTMKSFMRSISPSQYRPRSRKPLYSK